MQDLNNKILLHPDMGIGVKYIDYDKQIEYDTLSKQAMRNQIMIETLSEEMRVLYVALTRAKEKLIITGYSTADKQNKLEDLKDKYNELNSIILKKCKTYLDWFKLIDVYEHENFQKIAIFNVYNKNEVLKMCNIKQEKEENGAEQILKKLENVELCSEKQERIKKMLEYEYEKQASTQLKTKMSVTEIKELSKPQEEREENKVEQMPKFLQTDKETKITNAQKGTLTHLCMQKLDINKKVYNYDDVKQLINELEMKKIISSKEAEAININNIVQFTKSKLWEEMTYAHVVQREKPFYINIPAKELYQEDVDEDILVQGIIDLYYITEKDELVLVDFKTDYVENRNEQILINKYNTQLDLYKRALESATGKKVDRVYIYSTYLNKEIQYQ